MTTYYVATTGDNGDAGSLAAPWATLQYAVNQLSAGDTLYVRGGTYTTGFEIETDGTSGNEITIAAYNGETPIIDGGWDGVTFPFTPETWGQRYGQLIGVYGNYTTVDGFTVRNSTGRGIELFYANNSTIQNCTVYMTFNTGIEMNTCVDSVIDGCEVDHASQQRKWRNFTINGVYVNDHPNVLPMVFCQGCTVKNCTVHDSGGEGIDIFRSTACLIEDNVCYNCDGLLYYLNWAGDGSIIRNNIGFFTDDFTGVDNPRMIAPRSGIVLRDEPASAAAARFGVTRNAEIYNNIIVSPTQAIWITSYAGMNGTTIEHNTFVATGSGYCVNLLSPKDDISSPWDTSIIKNNVMVGAASIGAHGGITWSYNNWKTTPSTRAQGTGDIYSNPLLVDDDAAIASFAAFTETNYLLTASSPGIDQGNGSTYTTDFYGITRSSPDMGFAEYTTEVPPGAVITVPNDPATVGAQQTLSSASSTGAPTALVWEIDDVEVGTSSTYDWTPGSEKSYKIALTVSNAYGSDTETIYVYAHTASGGGGDTVAALLTGAVPGSTGSDGGTDHTDLGTATGGLLMVVSGATAAGTPSADSQIGIGGTDGTNHRAVAAASDDASADVFSGYESEAATAYLTSPQHTMIVDGDAALTDSDTVTITWNTVSSGKLYAALRIAATNVAVGDFVPGGTAVNVGFQPDVVLFWMTDDDADFAGSGGATANVSFGWITPDGSRSLTWRSVSGSSSGVQWLLQSETYVAAYLVNAVTLGARVSATITATGFSHSLDGTMAGKCAYMAFKLDGLDTEILDFGTETSTGTKSYTTSFEPGAIISLASLVQTIDSLDNTTDASSFSIGLWDGTNERSVSITDQDGAATTVSKSRVENAVLVIPDYDSTDLVEATVDSVSDTSLVLDYAAVDATYARKVTMLLIEAPAASAANYDYFQTGLQAGALAGMP